MIVKVPQPSKPIDIRIQTHLAFEHVPNALKTQPRSSPLQTLQSTHPILQIHPLSLQKRHHRVDPQEFKAQTLRFSAPFPHTQARKTTSRVSATALHSFSSFPILCHGNTHVAPSRYRTCQLSNRVAAHASDPLERRTNVSIQNRTGTSSKSRSSKRRALEVRRRVSTSWERNIVMPEFRLLSAESSLFFCSNSWTIKTSKSRHFSPFG